MNDIHCFAGIVRYAREDFAGTGCWTDKELNGIFFLGPGGHRRGGISLQRAVGLSCLLHRFNVFLYQQLMLDLGLAYATLLRQRGDSAGESGIIAWLHELKQLSGAYIPGEL